MKTEMHMKNHYGALGSGIFIILAICQLWVGCIGSGIRTTIHDDPQSQVYLEWVPKESFRASHPIDVSQGLIGKILSGVMIQQPSGIIDNLLKEDAKRSRVFSEEDVEQLVPHLVSALSQVTPEEQVVFKRTYPLNSSETETAGTIYIKDGLIFFTLTHYARKQDGPTISFYKGNREIPDPSGLRDVTLSFSPESAWRQDIKNTPSVISSSSGKTLVLDLKSLPSD